MKYLLLAGFAIMVLSQWIVPVKMISAKEEVLRKGKPWLFKTEPVDPTNPFVGKYIRLNFDASQHNDTSNYGLASGEKIFVLLEKDSAGFASIAGVSKTEPTTSADFVQAQLDYVYSENDTLYSFRISYPFDEFYMEESKAPKAELIYNKFNRGDSLATWARVKIWKGDAVTEDVVIDGKPIASYIKD